MRYPYREAYRSSSGPGTTRSLSSSLSLSKRGIDLHSLDGYELKSKAGRGRRWEAGQWGAARRLSFPLYAGTRDFRNRTRGLSSMHKGSPPDLLRQPGGFEGVVPAVEPLK